MFFFTCGVFETFTNSFLHLETPYQGLSCFAVLEELINLSLVNKTKTKRFFIFQNHGEFDVFWGFIIHFNEP